MFPSSQCALPDSAVKRLALQVCIGRVLFSKIGSDFAAEKHAAKVRGPFSEPLAWFPRSSKMV
jgi:hypothetical protein